MNKNSSLVRATQILFFANAALWLVFAIGNLLRLTGNSDDPAPSLGIIAALMFANMAAMVWCGFNLGKLHKLTLYLAVMLITVNIILTITDQIGVYDVLTLLVDLLILGLLLATRKQYSLPPEGGH